MGQFSRELAFTETYRRYSGEHVAIREAHCLRQQLNANLRPIGEADLFAGRIEYAHVGFGYEEANGGPNYYCWHDRIAGALSLRQTAATAAGTASDAPGEGAPGASGLIAGLPPGPTDETQAEALAVAAMLEFWRTETTLSGKLYGPIRDTEMGHAATNAITGAFGRLAGPLLNFDKLLQVGLPGLAAEVAAGRANAQATGGDAALFTGLAMSLQLLTDIANGYAAQATGQAAAIAQTNPARAAELREMACVLEKVAIARPETLREALQLFWLYVIASGVLNYGRMDVYMGDFLTRDLASGRLNEGGALRLLQGLWKQIADRGIWFNMRVIVGGMGRRNVEAADKFALLAMEATRTIVETEPQLTLRFHEGMNPALMAKALDVIGEGRTFPMLYNDDVNVPAVARAFAVERAEAEQYLPYGCGEYGIDHLAFGSPNSGFNALKALEATLHNGTDVLKGGRLGLQTGDFTEFRAFDDLLGAYKAQVEYHLRWLARVHALEYQVEAREAAHLYITLLYDDCLERGKAVVNGGAHYLGGIVESIGVVNAADSLTAIKAVVYDRGLISPARLLAALRANFEGFDAERRLLLAAPKYGNDDDAADQMVADTSAHLNGFCRDQAADAGLDYFLMVNINNFANVHAGRMCAASADGRLAGSPLANANNPTAGMDKKGVTAFLSSLARIDPTLHAGYVQNMKFGKRMFAEDRPKTEAMLAAYWASGGTQAMITVVDRQDLENALAEPEKYSNLMVRVGGFSARFVRLERDLQLDILNRTLN